MGRARCNGPTRRPACSTSTRNRIAPLALDYEERLIADLTPEERDALVLLIDRLTDMAARTEI